MFLQSLSVFWKILQSMSKGIYLSQMSILILLSMIINSKLKRESFLNLKYLCLIFSYPPCNDVKGPQTAPHKDLPFTVMNDASIARCQSPFTTPKHCVMAAPFTTIILSTQSCDAEVHFVTLCLLCYLAYKYNLINSIIRIHMHFLVRVWGKRVFPANSIFVLYLLPSCFAR